MCLTRLCVSMLFEQVTVMLCLTVIVAPFVGMFAGTMWVLVRVFGEWLWVVGCVRGNNMRSSQQQANSVWCAAVNPLVEPLAHLFRIMCGRGGTAQVSSVAPVFGDTK